MRHADVRQLRYRALDRAFRISSSSATIQSLIDDIINSVNILAERALNSVEQGLLNAPPSALGFKAPKSQSQRQDAANSLTPAERAKTEIEAGTHQLETLLCASIDRNFDKFEIFVLRNFLTVQPPELRDWMRLSHYEGLDFSSSPSSGRQTDAAHPSGSPNDTPTVESITALRRRLRESMRLNALLTAERAHNEALLDDLRRLVGDPASPATQIKTETASPAPNEPARKVAEGTVVAESSKSPFAFLHHKADLASSGGGAAPLATTAAFTLSQMQALRALSTALRNVVPDLKGSSASDAFSHGNASAQNKHEDDEEASGRGPKSWRRERVEYVQGATRRHLETVQGLELGKHGEVRDGEWQGSGRSLARGEVEGLERVVAMLGGGGEGESAAIGASSSVAAQPGEEGGEQMDES
ncbi:Mis12 protein-domain-containing protein [Xylariaceae sp. FL1651]|nr:Mis12 protein-domain-containing protein [Xylariaceae sp. FL1651]